MDSPDFMQLLSFLQLLILCGFFSTASWFWLVSTNSLNTNPKWSRTSNFILTFERFACIGSLLVLCGFFPTAPGFCLASHNSRSRAEHRIPFLLFSSLHGSSPVLYGFFPTSPGYVWLLSHSSLVLCGFHNSLNTNPKWNGTPDSILTFQQFAWISYLLVLYGFTPYIPRFCMAPFPTAPGFVMAFLTHSSWFCLASTTCLIQIRSGTEHRIPFLLLSSFAWIISWLVWLLSHSSYGFFPTAPGFVRLPQLA